MNAEVTKKPPNYIATPKGVQLYTDLIDQLLEQAVQDGTIDDSPEEESAKSESKEGSPKWPYPSAPWLEKILEETALLSSEEERALIRWYRNTNDESCRNIIVNAFLKLAYADAKKFRNPMSSFDTTLCFDDLFQEAVIGLIDALDHFEHRFGIRFSTYAKYWTRQKILFALSQDRCVRIPNNRLGLETKVRKAVEDFYQELGVFPTAREISEKIEINSNVSNDILDKIKGEIIDRCFPHEPKPPAQIAGHLSSLELPSVTVTYGDDLADLILTKNLKKEWLQEAFDCLDERERKVVILYFGLDNHVEFTLEEIGIHLKLTRERVRQIRNKALEKLQRMIDPTSFRDSYSGLTRALIECQLR